MERQATGKLYDEGQIRVLIIVSWCTWIALYTGKSNFAASIAAMIREEGFTRVQLGLAAALFFLTYGLGQMVSGVLGDHYRPAELVFIGLFSAACCNLAIGMASSVWVIQLICSLNGLAHSLIWPPMVRIFAELLSGSQCTRASVVMGTTGPVGMVATYGLCAWLIYRFDWRACYSSAAIILFAMALIWRYTLKLLYRFARQNPVAETVQVEEKRSEPKWSFRQLVAACGFVFLGGACCMHSVLKDGVNTWIPTYLSEEYAISASFSNVLAMCLPFVNLLGFLLTKWWTSNERHNEMRLTAVMFAVAAVGAAGIGLPAVGLLGTLLLLALITTAMTAANVAFVNILPVRFYHTGYVATMAGMLNASAYLGGAAASVVYGGVADRYGWGVLCVLWCTIAVAGVLLSLLGSRVWGRFRSSEIQE